MWGSRNGDGDHRGRYTIIRSDSVSHEYDSVRTVDQYMVRLTRKHSGPVDPVRMSTVYLVLHYMSTLRSDSCEPFQCGGIHRYTKAWASGYVEREEGIESHPRIGLHESCESLI